MKNKFEYFIDCDGIEYCSKNHRICHFYAEDGEICYYVLLDMIMPKLDGKNKYRRFLIKKVTPIVYEDEIEGIMNNGR